MMSRPPFGATDRLTDLLRRERERSDLIKRAINPGFALQETVKPSPTLAALAAAQNSGIVKTTAMLRASGLGAATTASAIFERTRIAALNPLMTASWMTALQHTAAGIARTQSGMLASQRALASAAAPELLGLGRMFETERSAIGRLVEVARRGEQFKALSERLAPDLAIIRIAAERARAIDRSMPRTGTVGAQGGAVSITGHVIAAQRLLEAIGQTDDPAQGVDLFAAFLTVIGTMFSAFGENTLKELRGVGAIKLLELFVLAVAIYQFSVPAEAPPADAQVHVAMRAQIDALATKVDQLIAADEAANEAYVAGYPRGMLRRDAAIRRDPQGRAPLVMRGAAGTQIFVKESRGRWRLVIYRDPLTEQLSKGWVFAPALDLSVGQTTPSRS